MPDRRRLEKMALVVGRRFRQADSRTRGSPAAAITTNTRGEALVSASREAISRLRQVRVRREPKAT